MDRVYEVRGDAIVGAIASARQHWLTILFHVTNDRGGWGRGFSGQLSRRWPEVERFYRQEYRDGDVYLGNTGLIRVAPYLTVANCCAQDGYSKPGQPAFRLDVLRRCMRDLASVYQHCHFVSPRVGAGLGGGQWPEILAMLNQELAMVQSVTVYSL